jgi:exodeoxyribonuclease VII small subunit
MHDTLSFEAALEKLQTLVKNLESGELSLEDSIKSFEEGVRLTRYSQEQLNQAERKIEILSRETAEATVELKPFSPDEKAN